MVMDRIFMVCVLHCCFVIGSQDCMLEDGMHLFFFLKRFLLCSPDMMKNFFCLSGSRGYLPWNKTILVGDLKLWILVFAGLRLK